MNDTRNNWRDIDMSMQKHPITGDVSALTGVNSLFQQLNNLFSISEKDIPFHPDLGYDLSDFLFENFDLITKKTITRIIELCIEHHISRVSLMSVDLVWEPQLKNLNVSITVKDKTSGKEYVYTNTLRRIT